MKLNNLVLTNMPKMCKDSRGNDMQLYTEMFAQYKNSKVNLVHDKASVITRKGTVGVRYLIKGTLLGIWVHKITSKGNVLEIESAYGNKFTFKKGARK